MEGATTAFRLEQVSQPWDYWCFGSADPLVWGAVPGIIGCLVFMSGLQPLDASSIPPHLSCNNQKCFQTLLNVPWVEGVGSRQKRPWVRTTQLEGQMEEVVLLELRYRVTQEKLEPWSKRSIQWELETWRRGLRQRGRGRNTLASFLSPQSPADWHWPSEIQSRARERQGMVPRVQNQCRDSLKTLALNKDKNLNSRSNFETGVHSVCQIPR